VRRFGSDLRLHRWRCQLWSWGRLFCQRWLSSQGRRGMLVRRRLVMHDRRVMERLVMYDRVVMWERVVVVKRVLSERIRMVNVVAMRVARLSVQPCVQMIREV
jgi:hypothetical protein